jgi:hypothetical protein
VKLASGISIAETAAKTGLSQPTVIGAVKAYEAGGWGSVPVAPRGRGIKKAAESARSSPNIKHFSTAVAYRQTPAELADPPPTLSDPAVLTHLQRLEAESIHIMREVSPSRRTR